MDFQLGFLEKVTSHKQENPKILERIDINKHNTLLESLAEALNDYVDFSEPHLNSHQLHFLGGLLDLSEDIIPKMANTRLAYPDSALDNISGTDTDQDAEALIHSIERKINFALGTEPEPGDLEHANYLFRKKAIFSSLLQRAATERYGNTIPGATTWNDVRTLFITRFSDGWYKFRHRMEIEHCIRADGEEIRNFLHRIKKTVDKGWPDVMVEIAVADEIAECTAQARQRRLRLIDYTLEKLRREIDGTSKGNLERFFNPFT